MGVSESCISIDLETASSPSRCSDHNDPVQALCRSIFTRDYRKCRRLSKRTDWEELTEDTARITENGHSLAQAHVIDNADVGYSRRDYGSTCNYPGCLSHRGPSNNLCLMADLPLHVLLTVSHSAKQDKKFYKIIKRLLKHGFNPNLQDFRGISALHAALSRAAIYTIRIYTGPFLQRHKDYTVKFVLALCESGAKFNVVDTVTFQSPLHKAAQYNMWACVRVLLKYGADINLADRRGRTAVMMASESGSVETIACLLCYKPNVQLHTSRGRTALHFATDSVIIEPAYSSFTIHKLLESGADPNVQDCNGDTPLHIASRKGASREVIVRLLRYGSDPSLFNKQGVTPFFEVMNIQHSRTFGLLTIQAFLECLPMNNPKLIRDSNNQLPRLMDQGPFQYLVERFGSGSLGHNPERLQDLCVGKIRESIGIRKLVDNSITVWKLNLPYPLEELICSRQFREALTIPLPYRPSRR